MVHHHSVAQHRSNRKNTQKQIKATRHASLLAAKSIFNAVDGTPRIIAVIPLCEDVRIAEAVCALAAAAGEKIDGVEEATKVWRLR